MTCFKVHSIGGTLMKLSAFWGGARFTSRFLMKLSAFWGGARFTQIWLLWRPLQHLAKNLDNFEPESRSVDGTEFERQTCQVFSKILDENYKNGQAHKTLLQVCVGNRKSQWKPRQSGLLKI